jgi:hypothetical protein
MKFDQFSDFHVEHHLPYKNLPGYVEGDPALYPWHTERQSDILILGGDCSNSVHNTEIVVFEAAQYYDHVIFLDGNHEHWCGRTDRTKYNISNNMSAFRKFAKQHDNITYMDAETNFVRDGVKFIGGCGWYDFKMIEGHTFKNQVAYWKKSYPDYAESAFGPNTMPWKLAYAQASSISRQVLRAQEDDDIKEIVISTHMVPHESGLVNSNHPFYHMNGAFGNSLLRWVWEADFNHKIKVWTFGHTHFTYDFIEEGIRFVCNPRGYGGERWKNSQRHILQIDTDDLAGSAFGTI